MSDYRLLGKPIPRLDSAEKVSGLADFGDDLRRPGLLAAKLLLSPHPHARIRKIDAAAARRIPGARAVVTAADFSGVRHGRLVRDEPLFAIDKALYVGERVAARRRDARGRPGRRREHPRGLRGAPRRVHDGRRAQGRRPAPPRRAGGLRGVSRRRPLRKRGLRDSHPVGRAHRGGARARRFRLRGRLRDAPRSPELSGAPRRAR